MDYREFIQLDLPVAVAIVSCGADWRVEEANAEFTDVLGYTEKELRETRPQKWYMTKIMQIWSVYWKMLSGHMTTEKCSFVSYAPMGKPGGWRCGAVFWHITM